MSIGNGSLYCSHSGASAQADQAAELFTCNWAASSENGNKDDDGYESHEEDLTVFGLGILAPS